MENCLIITAASDSYAPSLLALLGSLNLNWPNHPPVIIYDLGLNQNLLRHLERNQIQVRKVPAFCTHWRHHYTWKIWCLNDAPARDILWMDAGLVVLQPVDEMLEGLDRQGYFFTTNYELLDWEASDEACKACDVSTNFRNGKLTLPATLMGFRKTGELAQILEEALIISQVEKNIAATNVAHRHDQAIISLLVYKYLDRVLVADSTVYLGSLSPRQIPGQKIWVHRRSILKPDIEHFAAHITRPGEPYMPSEPYSIRRARSLSHLYRVYWCYGKSELDEARGHLEMAFGIDPTLKKDLNLLAGRFQAYRQRLRVYLKDDTTDRDFIDWALEQLRAINGYWFAWKLRRALFHQHDVFSTSDSVDGTMGVREKLLVR